MLIVSFVLSVGVISSHCVELWIETGTDDNMDGWMMDGIMLSLFQAFGLFCTSKYLYVGFSYPFICMFARCLSSGEADGSTST